MRIIIAIVLVLMFVGVADASPSFIYNWNTQTLDSSTTLTADTNDLIIFEVGANQSISTWHWYLNGVEKDTYHGVHVPDQHIYYIADNESSFRMWAGWYNGSIDNVSVYGENANGTTEMLTWIVNVNLETGSIEGYIKDNSTGSPIQGATVSIHNNQTTTDANGYYNLSNVPVGRYLLFAHKTNYNYTANVIDVFDKTTTYRNITLTSWITPVINYYSVYDTIWVESGYANLTLINESVNNASIIREISPGIWQINKSLQVRDNATLYITDEDCTELRMGGSYIKTYGDAASETATLLIDNVTVEGWNITNNAPFEWHDYLQIIVQYDDIGFFRNSIFNHTKVSFSVEDTTPSRAVLDGCSIYEGGTSHLAGNYTVLRSVITVSGASEGLFKCGDATSYAGCYLAYNSFVQDASWNANSGVGGNSTLIGNEFAGSTWNLCGLYRYNIVKHNILHWNEGNHNGFNVALYRFTSIFQDNLFYDMPGYSGYYLTAASGAGYGQWELFPKYHYIFNDTFDYRKNNPQQGVPQSFEGGLMDSYMYNLTCYGARCANIYGVAFNVFIRNIKAIDIWDDYGLSITEQAYVTSNFTGWIENVTIIDSMFNKTATGDILLSPNWTDDYGMPVFLINTYNETTSTKSSVTYYYSSNGNISSPDARNSTGYLMDFAWLDVLVQDESGSPIENASVSVDVIEGGENFTVVDRWGTNQTDKVAGGILIDRYPAISVYLPPPPQDYNEFHFPPVPRIENLTSVQTLSDGHTPPPNYGWSNEIEPSIALMLQQRKLVKLTEYPDQAEQTTWNYSYRITVSAPGYATNSSVVVYPDESWYRPYDSSDTYQNTTVVILSTNNPPIVNNVTVPVTCSPGSSNQISAYFTDNDTLANARWINVTIYRSNATYGVADNPEYYYNTVYDIASNTTTGSYFTVVDGINTSLTTDDLILQWTPENYTLPSTATSNATVNGYVYYVNVSIEDNTTVAWGNTSTEMNIRISLYRQNTSFTTQRTGHLGESILYIPNSTWINRGNVVTNCNVSMTNLVSGSNYILPDNVSIDDDAFHKEGSETGAAELYYSTSVQTFQVNLSTEAGPDSTAIIRQWIDIPLVPTGTYTSTATFTGVESYAY